MTGKFMCLYTNYFFLNWSHSENINFLLIFYPFNASQCDAHAKHVHPLDITFEICIENECSWKLNFK